MEPSMDSLMLGDLSNEEGFPGLVLPNNTGDESLDWSLLGRRLTELEADPSQDDSISPDREVQEVLRNQIGSRASPDTGGSPTKDSRKKRKSGEDNAQKVKHEGGLRWSCDAGRSAFTPYRSSTLLTNLSRGNVKTHAPEVSFNEVSLSQMAAQGELVPGSIPESEVNVVDSDGLTILMWASSYGQCKAVEMILDAGADPNVVGADGATALHFAAASGSLECIKRLVRGGAEVDHHDDNWNTALMYACFKDHALCAHELLILGADPCVENLCNETAYDICVNRKADAAKSVLERYFLRNLTEQLNGDISHIGNGDSDAAKTG